MVVRRFAWNPCQSGIKCPFIVCLRSSRIAASVAKSGGDFESSNDETRLFTVPLTDVKIRQAKAGNKRTKLTEGNGLYLLVKPSGSRLWRYKYRIVGKENLFRSASTQDARDARRCPRTRQEGPYPSHARQEVLTTRINDCPLALWSWGRTNLCAQLRCIRFERSPTAI
ncbi:Arm DNA-binding domain-containing protein [Burkholderia sp. 567]|uniref:Arm DNA-binding domain-containing protein n=1 Tax=Burkholderia sp. 567 TaxID=3156413 RepID=UPI003390D2DB